MNIQIKAYREPDGVTLLRIDAAGIAEARLHVESQGYRVIAAQRQWALPTLGRIGGGRQRFSVALFTQELVALLEAGMSLVETVEILSRKSRQSDTARILTELTRQLREGRSFSRALDGIPGAFPSLYIATVKSSERTGNLVEALRRYLAYHDQLHAVRDKVISASVYPILLMAVGLLVVFFLMGYVVPRFAHVYEDLGNKLPWMSRVLMNWGQFVSEYAWWVLAVVMLLVSIIVYAATRPSVRAKVMQSLWRLPSIGEHMRIYQLARFTRTVAMLLNGGVPLVTALDMADDLLRQPALRDGLQQASREVREGRTVSDAFGRHGLATEVGMRMLVVGERSGNLGEMMDRIAKVYDDEIARAVEWFSRLLEPLLMVAIGLVIGFVVLLMYMPIFELATSIQ